MASMSSFTRCCADDRHDRVGSSVNVSRMRASSTLARSGMVGDQPAHHGVDVDHVRDLGPDHLGERLVANRPHMLVHHVRRGHELRGDAVPCQTVLDELGQLVAGEGVQLAAGAVGSGS